MAHDVPEVRQSDGGASICQGVGQGCVAMFAKTVPGDGGNQEGQLLRGFASAAAEAWWIWCIFGPWTSPTPKYSTRWSFPCAWAVQHYSLLTYFTFNADIIHSTYKLFTHSWNLHWYELICAYSVIVCCFVQLGVDHKSVTDWWCFMRDLCSWDLLNNPVQLGGPGWIVAVDETVVARAKPTKNARPRTACPSAVGVRCRGPDYWRLLYGAGRPAWWHHPYTHHSMERRTRQQNVERWMGSIQRAHCCRYQHETVNQLRHFVNPVTGVHTNNIEAQWAACKATMKRHYRVPRHLLSGFLDEYMWWARHPRPNTLNDTLNEILDVIRRHYPVWIL